MDENKSNKIPVDVDYHKYKNRIMKHYLEVNCDTPDSLPEDFFKKIFWRLHTEACLEHKILLKKEKEGVGGLRPFPGYINHDITYMRDHVNGKKAFLKFVNDEMLYESQRRAKRGKPFASEREAVEETAKAVTKRAIDYFGRFPYDGDKRENGETFRCSLESYFD